MVVYSNGMRYATSGKHPWVTTTWERAEKRRRQAFESDWKDFGSHEGVTRLNRAENDKKVKAQLRIVKRVKQKHPEFSNVKARLYARKHGLFGKASSGRSGGGRNLLWLLIEKLKSGKTAPAAKENEPERKELLTALKDTKR